MKNRIYLSTFILITTFLYGCASKETKTPLEDIGMVGVMAFDNIDEDLIKVTVAIPQSSAEAEENTQIFSVKTDLVSEGIVEVEALSDSKIVLNQLRVVLINEEFARQKDVDRVIQQLYRNAEVGNNVLLAIVKGNGEEMLEEKYPDKASVISYLSDLLQPSINTAFNPNTDIHSFIYAHTNPVLDSIVPLLEKRDGKIQLDGVALLKGDKMLKSLNKDEALIIQALKGKKNLAPLNLSLDEEGDKEEMMIDLIDSKVKMDGNKDLKNPKLSIVLSIKGTLVEIKGERENKLKTEKSITQLEKDLNKQLEEDIRKFLGELQEDEVDPIGLTESFRMHYDGKWTEELTYETLKKLEFNVDVKMSILSKGILK